MNYETMKVERKEILCAFNSMNKVKRFFIFIKHFMDIKQ